MTQKKGNPSVVGIGFLFGALLGLVINGLFVLDFSSSLTVIMVCVLIGACIGYILGGNK